MAAAFGSARDGQDAAPGRGGALGAGLARWLRDLAGLGDGAQPGRVTVHTLTLTRWVAVIGQLFTVLLVHFSLGIPLPLAHLLPAIALSGVVNVALLFGLRATARLPESGAAALYAYDLVQLCYLLALTGGVQNPFTSLLLVPVALAAASLDLRSTVAVTGLGILGLAVLTLEAGGLPWRGGQALVLPLPYRLAIAAGVCIAAVLIGTCVWGLAEAARRRADALHATQLALAREQQLSALGGQAAAAAHLLGTPLGTITIIARELVRELPGDGPLALEARELLGQAQRCREILKTLGRSGQDREHARFTGAPFSVHVEQIAAELARPGIEVAVRVEPTGGGGGNGAAADPPAEPVVAMPPEFRHSLANLIDNAIRFATARVEIAVRPDRAGGVALVIEDDGPGFPAEVLDWVGEPFLAGRREGAGLGLGIFIAMTLLARTGGRAHFGNRARGARVTVSWPPNALGAGH